MALGEYDFSPHYGWIQDTYGLSWQIIPECLNTLLEMGNAHQKKAVTEAFLQMKKFDIDTLHQAYEGAR